MIFQSSLSYVFPFLLYWVVLFLSISSPLYAHDTNSSSKSVEQLHSEEDHQSKFDPYAGIDSEGRILKVDLPDDIINPHRWRYIPEGRIKPGNLLQRFAVSSFVVPLFFFEQDIGAGGGVAITDIDFRQQRRREFAGTFLTYTTEGQQRYTMVWQKWLYHRELDTGGVVFEERSFLRSRVGYQRTLTRRFFGFGSDTKSQDETSYTDEVSSLQFLIQQSVPDPGDNVVYQISLKGEHHNLASGRVSDRPSTEEIFPDPFAEGDEHDILWIGASLRYDTRDSQHAPYRGWMLEMALDSVPVQSTGGSAAIVSLQGNWVLPLPGLFHSGGDAHEEHPPTDVFAFGAQMRFIEGELPFWALPTLGGRKTLRGYIANRFTDKALWHAGAEYRFWTIPRGFALTDSMRIERLGAALFYDIGTVADSLEALRHAHIQDSYGISFRFFLERTALFRADLGFSREDVNFIFAYGLSF